ncbi:MAG TPA: GMC family oxidoreductase [Dongiaceae bacterium]|nr:GMC family oxidoreductase [Dongiaceae bacterium]
MKNLPAVDAVIVGGGWTGLLMAKELGARSGLTVAVLERGKSRESADYPGTMDELDYAIRTHMMQDLSQETVTIRHDSTQRALPMRQYGSFLPGTGVGGAGEHWNGITPRFLPDSFELLSRTIERYGAKRLPADHSIQDWGVTYDEMEAYYTRTERMLGISGKAGNIRGKKIDGGNIFEGRRSGDYPTPPTKIPYFSALFGDAAKSLGYHPYPTPAANLSEPYTNPDGISRSACFYCGFCERFGCMVGAKAQPTNTLLPLIQERKNISIRSGASVRRVLCDAVGKKSKARGVTYFDEKGEEFFQPAELVVLASWTLNNTRLLLLSSIGEPYDAGSRKGTVGRNLTHQISVAPATAFFEKPLNRFMGSGAAGVSISDFDGDVFDHSQLSFLGGGHLVATSPGYRPIANFGAVPPSVKTTWGSAWKKAALESYDRTGVLIFTGDHLAYKSNYMDLDPTYKDQFGDPLLRFTINWGDNERKIVEFVTPKAVELARAMGAKEVSSFPGLKNYDANRYQTTHIQGGTIMGNSPDRSVVNPYLQHWQVPNLFVLGASTFPQNPSAHPTLTLLALTYRTADAIVDRYLKSPSQLA